jgi:hypothetical protein
MSEMESPGALAALGASKIDQLGGKVDPENSPNSPTAQPLRLRAGNAAKCLVCGSRLKPKRARRRQKYCSSRCRDEARRDRNFKAFASTRRVSVANTQSRAGEPAPPDPGIRPGGIRDRALRALHALPADPRHADTKGRKQPAKKSKPAPSDDRFTLTIWKSGAAP